MKKRKKKGLALIVVFTLLMMQLNVITWAQASDITTSWAKKEISEWADKGWARSYEDGTFKPNQAITRAEFVEILNNAFEVPKEEANLNFSDVRKDDWFYKQVAYAKNAGYIGGYPDGTFKPNGFITRQEASKIIATMLNMNNYYKRVDDKFKDSNHKASWAADSVNGLVGYGIISGYPNGNLGYNNNITRAEAVVILKRARDVVSGFTGIQALVSNGEDILQGATVKLFDENGKYISSALTNDEGKVEFKSIKKGNYYVTSNYNDLIASSSIPVVVRDHFTTIQSLQSQKAIEVKGLLVDKNNKPAPKDTSIILKDENYIFTTLQDGSFKGYLLPNTVYNASVYYNGFKNIGEIKTGLSTTDLGTIKTDFEFGRSTSSFLDDDSDYETDTTVPVITVNTEQLQYDDSFEAYVVNEKLSALSGTITDSSTITSISYKIMSKNLPVSTGTMTPSNTWRIDNPTLLIGENKVVITAKDSASNVGTITVNIVNLSEENMEGIQLDQADDDSDGLLNYQEIYYNTDKTKPDTDGDGLSDFQELAITMTDPLKVDTDSNGITDDQEDFDQDGIKNIDELKLNGNPYSIDTDFDGLKDDEEALKGTKLDESDTDNDKLSDSKEVELGTDPLNPDTDGDGILDGDELFNITHTVTAEEADPNVVPILDIELPGDLAGTLHIGKLPEDDMYLPKEIPGYLGAGYEFELGGTFDTPASLTYKFNPEFLSRETFNPAIYYCDTENQEMVLLENQTVDLVNCTVTAPVTHFSKYILIDKTQFDKVFEVEIKGPTEIENLNKPLDVVLVIDSSGSMSSNDYENIRLKVAKEFVDKLSEKDRVGIVDFDSSAYTLCHLTTNKEDAKIAIDSIDSSGGTSLTAGIKKAFEQFGRSTKSTSSLLVNESTDEQNPLENNQMNGLSRAGIQREALTMQTVTPSAIQVSLTSNKDIDAESVEALKYVIMLTDGEGSYNSNLTTQAIQNNITIYTVGLGSYIDETLLTKIATQTGGKYYNAAVADDLIQEFDRLTQDVVDITKDSDNDGLSDYHEERLRWFNGISIQTDPNNPDTDGDGLLDGEEVSIVYTTNDNTKSVHHYNMSSLPVKKDSDNDGIDDKIDPNKCSYDITDRTLALVAGLSYTNLEKYIGKTIGEILKLGVRFENLEYEYAQEIKDAEIIFSNESGVGWWGDISDRGLGSVAVKIKRTGKKDTIIYGLRGTEPDKDGFNDFMTDGLLGLGWSSAQSDIAFQQYKAISSNENRDYVIAGHSLGGRLVQDVIYKVYNSNEGFLGMFNKTNIPTPVHSATFNGLGYNAVVYKTLENDILEQYRYKLYNYYFEGDLVGNSLGANPYGTFVSAGVAKPFIAKDKQGDVIPVNSIVYEIVKVHDIKLWHCSPDLKYPTLDLYF